MKKISLRVLSVVLSVALLCGLLPVMGLLGSAAAAADGITYYDGNAVVIKPDKAGDATFTMVMTDSVAVTATTRYTISYKVRIPDAGVSVWPNLQHTKTSGTTAEVLTAYTVTGATAGWQTVSFDIVTAEDQTALNVRLTAKGGLVYVDDLSVSVSGIVADEDYANGIGKAYVWDYNSVVSNGGTITTTHAANGGVNGTGAMSVETTGSVVIRPLGAYVVVAGATTYAYTFKVNLPEGMTAYPYIVTEKPSGTAYTPYSAYTMTGTADAKWQTITMHFKSYDDVTSIHPGIMTTGAGTVLVDDVCLRKVEGDVNHIQNGDFEMGANGAAPVGAGHMGAGTGGTYVKVDGAGVDGSAAVLATPTDNGSLYFRPYNAIISLKASTTYVVNFRFKAGAEVQIQGFSTQYGTNGNSWPAHNTVSSNGSADWQSGTIEFTTAADTTGHEFNMIVKNGPAYLDDVVMIEKNYKPTSLIANGDFENGADGSWPTGFGATQLEATDTGKMIRVSGAGVDGSAAALIEAQGYYALAKDVAVDPSSTYRISYVVKIPSAEASLTPYICQYKDANKTDSDVAPKIIPYANIVKGACDWKEVEFTINTASDAALLQLRMMAEGGEVYLDDLKVIKVNNLVYNGNFEEGTTGWFNSGIFGGSGETKVVTDASRGNVMQVVPASGMLGVGTIEGDGYYIPVEPATKYVLSYWLKQEGETVSSRIMTRQRTDSGDATDAYAQPTNFARSGDTDGWVQVKEIYTSSADATRLTFIFAVQNGTALIDDVCMEKLPIVINSDFENGTTGWGNSIFGSDGSFSVVADAERGNNVLKINSVSGYGVGSFQNNAHYIHVEPSTEYRVSYWLKMEDDADAATTVFSKIMFRSFAVTGDSAAPYAQPTNFQFTGATDGWVKVEERYTTDATCTKFSIIFGAYNGTVSIDNVTVEKVSDSPIDNSGFEAMTDGIPTGFAGKGMVTGTAGIIETVPAEASFAGATATLGEDIVLNLHIKSAFPASAISVSLNEADFVRNAVQLTMEPTVEAGEVTTYMAKVHFAAKNMADTFTATLYVNGVETDTLTYSVKEYAMSIYNDANGVYSDEASNVAKALLNYGAEAQTYFNHNTSALANANLAEADRGVSTEDIAGLSKEVPEAVEHFKETNAGTFYGDLLSITNNVADDAFGTIDTATAIAEVPAGRSFQYEGMTAVTVGETYNLSFWAKVSTGTITLQPIMYVSGWSGSQSAGSVSVTSEWQFFNLTYTPASAHSTVQFNIQTAISTGTVVSIANISLKNKVDDGNLYTGADLSTYYGANVGVATVSDVTYKDGKTLMMTSLTGVASSSRLLFNATEPGKTYEVSFMAKSSSGNLEVMPIFVGSGLFDGSFHFNVTEEWQRVSFTYKHDSVAWAEIQLQPNAWATGTVISFADVSVKEVDTTTITDYLPVYSDTKLSTDVFLGYTLVLQDTSKVRLYFTTPDVTVTMGDTPYTPVATGEYYCVELLADVTAKNLDTAHDISITAGDTTMTISNFSVLAPAALEAGRSGKMKNVCTSLILYAEAVNAYVA